MKLIQFIIALRMLGQILGPTTVRAAEETTDPKTSRYVNRISQFISSCLGIVLNLLDPYSTYILFEPT
jgi:hypothetical protein